VSKRVLVAAPRSFCAGVVRAIDIVEKLLDQHGPPVYVRHEIVHNVHVVRDLEARGAVFVESEDEVPEGELIVLSAHGVAPKVYEKCAERGLKVVDAVCPLVSKVHAEARRYAGRGLKIALVGHAGHVEVEGTMGEAPESILLVETPEDARNLEVEDGEEVAYITQTTLSLDDTADVVDTLRERFPNLVGPPSADICYATQNRQDAVKRICEEATLVLVVGSRASSNANRLVEVARDRGADAYLIDDETDLDPAWLDGHETVGLTARSKSPARTSSSAFQRICAPNSA
jgi:4-hydroxy-3-methylbut-2-enyl diphosphate reductase